MGSVYPRGNKLWIRYKGYDNKWTQRTTPYSLGQEKEAQKLLKSVERMISAETEISGEVLGPLTVRQYSDKWLNDRAALVSDISNDRSRTTHHILPAIGDLILGEVRPQHLVSLIRTLRAEKKIAQRTVYNVYAICRAMFRDACLAGLIEHSPCILTKYQLGPVEDKNSEWRATALYTREELETLISEPRIPPDRQVMYALQGLAALRHGEAAGLRWRHYESDMKPLGRLLIATSYNKGVTKTRQVRHVPTHKTLAAILAEWKLEGWSQMFGRIPEPDDLVCPIPPGGKLLPGSMRDKNYSYKKMGQDLELLGLRHRRVHDLKRTMITLARTDGARKDILELITHSPGKGSTIDLYTSFPWESRCAEVAKLNVNRKALDNVIQLPKAKVVNGEPEQEFATDEFATALATVGVNGELNQEVKEWRRRESNPGPEVLH